MVVYSYLLNNNFLLYRDIINPYPPLLTYLLSIPTRLFGYHPLSLQILTWIIIMTCDLLIYVFVKKSTQNRFYAFACLAFFLIISIPLGINGLWFDLVQTPFILASFYFFYKFSKNNQNIKFLSLSLIFLIAASLIKQQALWLFFAYFAILMSESKFRKVAILKEFGIFLLILALINFAQFLFFWTKGLQKDFVFWTIYFPLIKASSMPGYILLPSVRQLTVVLSLYLIFLPIIMKKKSLATLVSLPMLAFAYPRFDYFHLIPALSILSFNVGENLKFFKLSKFSTKIVVLFALVFLFVFTTKYIRSNRTWQVRFFEQDIHSAAIFMSKVTQPDEPIYIQNGPDQILPIAGRLPTKPWADEFPWYLEIEGLQEKVIQGVENQNPKYVIFKPYEQKDNYEIGSYRPQILANYLDENYRNHFQINESLWLKIKK